MFQCHACFRRFLRTLDTLTESPSAFATSTSNRRTLHSSSHQADRTGFAAARRPRDSRDPKHDLQSSRVRDAPTKWQDSAEAAARRRDIAAVKRKSPGELYQEKQLRRELEWLKDPMKLSDHVASLLDKDDYPKALALARLSNRAMENTVSWNHLIDYNMQHGKGKIAIDIFNEVRNVKQHGRRASTNTSPFR